MPSDISQVYHRTADRFNGLAAVGWAKAASTFVYGTTLPGRAHAI